MLTALKSFDALTQVPVGIVFGEKISDQVRTFSDLTCHVSFK